MNYLHLLLLLIPALAIAAIVLRACPKTTATVATAANFLLSVVIFFLYVQHQAANPGGSLMKPFDFDAPWAALPGLPTIHLHFAIDGLNLPLIILATTVSLAAILVSPADCKRNREFFSYLLLMSLGGIGAFLSFDLFFFYIFHEFALIPTFLLIGIWGPQNRSYAAMQITLYLTLGSLLLLGGLVLLVLSVPAEVRTWDMLLLQQNLLVQLKDVSARGDVYTHFIFAYPLLLIGFGILISLFPFHSWAPAGYAAAPPGAAMLHAGVLKKFGVYGLLRIAAPLIHLPTTSINDPVYVSWAGWAGMWQIILILLLVGNILYIGFVTIAQKELQTMLGYSSVMHMGYLFLGLVAFNQVGLCGVVLLMVAHGLSAALLFGLAGEIQQRTGENRMDKLGGLATQAPMLATFFLIGSMASIGLPGLANFSGELLIFMGGFQTYPSVTFLAVWGVVISGIYQLRAVAKIFYGPKPAPLPNAPEVTDLTFTARLPYILLIAALFLFGMAPQILLQIVQPSISKLLGGV
ncbi:MAG: NuoM family protein [Candidatus Methylacidiphilales bacterium]|nr:NADH-quinone oxidoreductase subunit M [Candidatus Methylacidiphilales bacterium]